MGFVKKNLHYIIFLFYIESAPSTEIFKQVSLIVHLKTNIKIPLYYISAFSR